MQAVTISNDFKLYGSDHFPSYDMTKGFNKPLTYSNHPIPIPDEIIAAHETLKAKRKLNIILRYLNFNVPSISVEYLVQVLAKNSNEKRGKWLSARSATSIDISVGF